MNQVYQATEADIFAAISEIYDPEIGIDIVSLGLIYSSELDPSGTLTIRMTLTTPYCPLAATIQDEIVAQCAPLPGVEKVVVELVWSPPWDPRTMATEEARLELGIY